MHDWLLYSGLAITTMMMFGNIGQSQELENGVSLHLASHRKSTISSVEYQLELDLSPADPIDSKISIHFSLSSNDEPVVLDFSGPPENVLAIRTNGKPIKTDVRQGHIVIPASALRVGSNRIDIEFVAGNQSLNRNDKFLYTLLVPDRASTVFPCFDQPDLKATFQLTLTLPKKWIASANGPQTESRIVEDKHRVQFAKTKPLSTYLFAFAAGEFQQETREIDGRKMTMYYRETDQDKVQRNVDAIFKIHSFSLDWLEEYTDIKYPFQKFDFVLIPSFQYGGMEHVGNIFYNADSLFLETSATKDQMLNRASLIAHETAHMWFGDLVTMKWFDDVWLKEVFANFMAAKIVHPTFPEVNHDLGFLLKHHPSAYGEDRSRGSYPIQQRLGNLRNAGTLYGRIIYMKAPVVMRQLETMIGPKELRAGLREYLKKFSYDNAVWDDLITILDRRTDKDLKSWSEAWVKEPGTPEIAASNEGKQLIIKQLRKTERNKYWSQQIDIKLVSQGKLKKEVRTLIDGETTVVQLPELNEEFDFLLVNGSELGYGYFRLDKKSTDYLLEHAHEVKDDVTRGAVWIALYEAVIRGDIEAPDFLPVLKKGIESETEPLNRQNLISQLSTIFWKFLSTKEREAVAAEIETVLWTWIDSDISNDARSTYFKALVNIATGPESVNRLHDIWENESDVNKLKLAETDFMTLAYELAVRLPDQAEKIMNTQLNRLKNEDRKKRFQFVTPALLPDPAIRDGFFNALREASNRRPEKWALEGLKYLHHPLRAEQSEKYIRPSLELLEEIQLTGDIFFPKRWLMTTLGGHRSESAAKIVKDFLNERPDYPYRLRNKILQAADLLFIVAGKKKNSPNEKE